MDSPTLLCIYLPQALELRKKTLESHGFNVKFASSSLTAMKMLEEASVAAVLLEYKHEGMDSEAIACRIKQRFPNLPIILLSAYFEMPERILWLVDDYVMKSELPGNGWCRSSNECTSSHYVPTNGSGVGGRSIVASTLNQTPRRYALFPRYSFVSPAALVGRLDRFCSLDRRSMPASFGKQRGTSQTCRAE